LTPIRLGANNNPSNQRRNVICRCKSSVAVVATAFAAALTATEASAQWTQFSLPNLGDAYDATAFTVLPNGSYVFAQAGTYYHQNGFGAAGYSRYSNVSPSDSGGPSFLAAWSATEAVAGAGGLDPSDLYVFNPSALSAPGFTAQGLSLQNYGGVFINSDSLYVAGANGSGSNGYGGGENAISYVNLSTGASEVIIDQVSTYSAALALDTAGNLYVADEDNDSVYKFTATQLSLSIAGSTPLAITNGTFVYQSGNSLGTMAIDSQDRIWSSGYLESGLQVYDPATGLETTVIPGLTNDNYMVTTFSAGGQGYVAYTDQANPGEAGTAQYYGFEAIPEPATLALTLTGLVAVVVCRRKSSR